MNSTIQIFGLALLLIMMTGSAQSQEKTRIIDRGTDGDARYYSVICASGQRSSITNYYEEGKICTVKVNGRLRECRNGWDLDSAAIVACN